MNYIHPGLINRYLSFVEKLGTQRSDSKLNLTKVEWKDKNRYDNTELKTRQKSFNLTDKKEYSTLRPIYYPARYNFSCSTRPTAVFPSSHTKLVSFNWLYRAGDCLAFFVNTLILIVLLTQLKRIMVIYTIVLILLDIATSLKHIMKKFLFQF